MANKKLYIWQLQEKEDSINKNNSYCIIYDDEVKKVSVSKLYDFFNQDDKILDIQNSIEGLLREYDSDLEIKYADLDVSIVSYDELVKELQEKFKINEDNIRKLITRMSKLEYGTEDIDTSFNYTNSKYETLSSTIQNFKEKISELNDTNNTNTTDIQYLIDTQKTLQAEQNSAISILNSVENDIERIKNDKSLDEKTNDFINRVNDEYNKIVTIIDYYHHIHTENYVEIAQRLSKYN